MFLELQKLQHPWHLEHSTTQPGPSNFTLPYLTLPQAYLVRKGGAMFLELQKLQHPWHLEHSTTHAHYGVCLAGGTK